MSAGFAAGVIEDVRGLEADEAAVRARERDRLKGIQVARFVRSACQQNALIPAVPAFVTTQRTRQARVATLKEVEDALPAHYRPGSARPRAPTRSRPIPVAARSRCRNRLKVFLMVSFPSWLPEAKNGGSCGSNNTGTLHPE